MARKAKATGARSSERSETPPVEIPYLELGRTNQKLRTRDALVEVAVDMIRRGEQISVSDVADAARVSRTTAYRYFPTTEMLAAQATVTAANLIEAGHIQEIIDASRPPDAKLDDMIVGIHKLTASHEAAFRSLVRFTVDARPKESEDLPRRLAFRRQWLEGSLNDLRKELGTARFNRLTAALSLFCGIESIIVLHDLCHLSSDDALKIKRWAAQELLKSALAEAQGSGRKVRSADPAASEPETKPDSSSRRRRP